MTYKPKVLVDFDGPIHRYSKNWHDGTAYDEPTGGSREALDWMDRAGYEVVIFSSRDAWQIEAWLEKNNYPAYRVTNIKEPAVCQIDDRGIRWTNWTQSLNDLHHLYP